MVWFQCEDCGENLKKPKLPNHFRACSANKFSCIDCGVIFGQQSVQSHTQCVTEAEKYGPKGEGKASSVSATKAKNDAKQKQKPDVDINVGLSERPPWFCSLCNTKATSKQTLLLHADGKKHRAKARAHAAKQQPESEASTPDANIANGDAQKCELPSNPDVKETKEEDPRKAAAVQKGSEAENLNLSLKKKRKNSEVEIDGALKKCVAHPSGGLGNGEASHIANAEAEETVCQVKKAKHNVPKEREGVESSSEKKDNKKKIKWKKLITSALKSNPDRVVKMKKLRKLVLKALRESGVNEDKSHFGELLEQKINSSSRFTVVNKNVHLVAKN